MNKLGLYRTLQTGPAHSSGLAQSVLPIAATETFAYGHKTVPIFNSSQIELIFLYSICIGDITYKVSCKMSGL